MRQKLTEDNRQLIGQLAQARTIARFTQIPLDERDEEQRRVRVDERKGEQLRDQGIVIFGVCSIDTERERESETQRLRGENCRQRLVDQSLTDGFLGPLTRWPCCCRPSPAP